MAKKIAILHTVRSVLLSFEPRLREAMPEEEMLINNTLDEFLLTDANKNGFTQENLNRLYLILKALEAEKPDVIVVSCSTLTPRVELIKPFIGVPIIAIDDAMSAKAAALGSKVLVMATAPSTVEPTVSKILADGAKIGVELAITRLICSDAYAALQAGEGERHDNILREAAKNITGQDVIVLAQASMAHLQQEIQDISGIETVSSPDLCVAQVKEFLLG